MRNRLRPAEPNVSVPTRAGGFSLIELLVTIALLAILLGLAAPSFRSYIVSSQLSTLANDFVMGTMYSRAEAISKNRCVTMCISTDANAELPVCSTTASDWNNGWIIFANRRCDDDAAHATAELLKVYAGNPTGPTMVGGTTQRRIRFDSRGMTSLTSANTFNLAPPGESFTKSVCLSSAGRARIVDGTTTCTGAL